MEKEYSVTIGWLYPDLMSTYGDRGNIMVLTKLCEWNNIGITILPITQSTSLEKLQRVDFIFGGGSQDTQQEIVMRDLLGSKGEVIKELIERNVSALFVCGSPQLMGTYYEPAVGKRIEGLGIFDMVSENPGPDVPRCIGNVIAETDITGEKLRIVGFENHGGRTYLGSNAQAFAKVLYGNGNNGKDGTEGVMYKNAIGCYFHGPLLPKNPEIGKYLLEKTLLLKYKKQVTLAISTDHILASKAKDAIIKRYLRR